MTEHRLFEVDPDRPVDIRPAAYWVEITCRLEDAELAGELLNVWATTGQRLPRGFSLRRESNGLTLRAYRDGLAALQVVDYDQLRQARIPSIILVSAVESLAHALACRAGEVPEGQRPRIPG